MIFVTTEMLSDLAWMMDDLKDVNELASKYPEARPMINRKKKTDKEKE